MAKQRRSASSDAGETRAVQVPPAHFEHHTRAEILGVLMDGPLALEGLLPWSSNYTFLALAGEEPLQFLAVYKPCRGERPLWDFPNGTLCRREYATYVLSEALGWDLVPPTVLRDGPHGLGSVQLFIDCDQEQHYFTLRGTHEKEFRRMAVFDALLNNTDRKGGHCLVDRDDKIWAIDHGVTFHTDPKLRTVIWDFAGQRIPAEWMADLNRFRAELKHGGTVAQEMEKLLAPDEIDALLGRLSELLDTGSYPEQNSDWYTVPWPPV
jgi:Phosphatidylinositol 3- and 4-kinase